MLLSIRGTETIDAPRFAKKLDRGFELRMQQVLQSCGVGERGARFRFAADLALQEQIHGSHPAIDRLFDDRRDGNLIWAMIG